jgi:1-acyl-sn-glycerol-3-phosphate acyltransferase
MLDVLRGIRSFASMVLVGAYFTLGSIVLRLAVIPAIWLFPNVRYPLTSAYFKTMAWGIFACLTVGGARFRRRGFLPTATPIAIVANHQALTDILQVALLGRPRAPAYVSRTRYARWVPLVSATIRLLRCPLVDPTRDPRGALEAIRDGARTLPHGLLIFPEGHRSRDGHVGRFRAAGLEAMLRARRVPVYLVVNDGAWRVRTFIDLLYRAHLIDARSEVLGPFEIPENPDAISAFIHGCREKIVRHQAEMRGEVSASGGSSRKEPDPVRPLGG